MLLLSLLLAVLARQFLGESNPLHRDGWIANYGELVNRLRVRLNIPEQYLFPLAASLLAILVISVSNVLSNYSAFVYTLFAATVLLYSFGRGSYTAVISEFIVAEAKNDWPRAIENASRLGLSAENLEENNWQQLNKQFLQQASYRGFERFFAVAFWFALLGPAGALIYRFSYLWHQQLPCEHCSRWLWIIEWPAVRVLGLSYAITGNFASSFNEWKRHVGCRQRSTDEVLLDNMLGALSVDDRLPQSKEVTRRELDAMQALQSRTLWFWLGAIAMLFLFI